MPIPKALQDRLRDGRVIPFVGAGVSMNVLDRFSHEPVFPSWRQLLSHAADRLEEETKTAEAEVVRSLLKVQRPDFLYAAGQAREALGAIWFEFLKDKLDIPFERIYDESLELARLIWRLGSNLIITTNYDEVLRWACPRQQDLQSWDITAPVEQASLLQQGLRRPVVWHLHGRISKASQIILTAKDYQLLYPTENHGVRQADYEAALQTFRHQVAAKSLLFVGFSLDDQYLGVQLDNVNRIYSGAVGPHFALVSEREVERVRNMDLGIEFVTFSDFGKPLLNLLSELAEAAESHGSISQSQRNQSSQKPIVVPDYGPHRTVFFVPFRQKGDEIVGQEQAIEAVRKQLTEGKRTAIGQTAAFRGLGGLGKTQLAVEYAYRFRDEYPNGVIWINADQDIDAQLIEIAERAHWIAPESDHKYKLEIAQRRIRTYSNCLIVFDNLDDRSAIDAYLPEPEANPHILITSRIDHADFFPVPLNVLDQRLSLELLIKEAGREPETDDDKQAAKEIVDSLGGLPLAIELAGAYLSHRPTVSFRQYQRLLVKDLRTAMPQKFSSFTGHEADLYRTLKLSEDLLREGYLPEILDLLSWSGSAPMSSDLISTLLVIPDDAGFVGALSLGTELRLLQRSTEVDSYSLHRLVGEVRRREIPLDQRIGWVAAICDRLGNWFQSKRQDFALLTIFEAEIDHLRAWQESATQFAPSASSRLIWLQAYPAYHRGRYTEARNYLLEAKKYFDEFTKSDDELAAHLLNDIATTDFTLSAFHSAQAGHLKALEVRRTLFGEKHTEIAMCLSNVSSDYRQLGNLNEAIRYGQQALVMRKELFGDSHPDIAASLDELGTHYGQFGDTHRALQYLEQALIMRRKLFVEPHPDIAASMNSAGFWYYEHRNHTRALEYSESALRMMREIYGEVHPQIAAALKNVGFYNAQTGNLKRGLECSERAVAMYRELFGERHPDVASSLVSVGYVYRKLGNFERAMNCFQEGLAQYRELLNPQHQFIATALSHISELYSEQGDYTQALEYARSTLSIRVNLLGERQPLTADTAADVVSLLMRLDKRQEAYELVANFLPKVPTDRPVYDYFKQLEARLLSSTLRKGFRQPPKRGKKKVKKKRP